MLLRDYLKNCGMTHAAFAEKLGTSRVYLCHMLAGRKKIGRELAKKIETATEGKVSRMEAIYPEDFEEERPDGHQLRFPSTPKN